MKKNKSLKYILLFLTLVFSFLAWNAVDRAINVKGASLWVAPVIFFSLVYIFLSLAVVLVKERLALEITAFFLIFFSAIFAPFLWQLVVLLFSFLFLSLAIGKIRKDLRLNIKVDLYKSMRSGSALIVLAFSLLISSQYFFETRNTSLENIVPKFNLSSILSSIAPKIISTVNPEFSNIQKENLNVDQWILETQKDKISESSKLNPEMENSARGEILQEGRAQLAEFSGQAIIGTEKMADVLTKTVTNRLNNFVAPDYSGNKFPVLPFVVSIALFLTLYSIGSFLDFFWIWIAELFFWILKKCKLVKITERMEDVETIE